MENRLPGKKISDIDEEVWFWLGMANGEDEKHLTVLSIVDEKNGYGIYSYDRPALLEQAQIDYENYNHSYEYYMDLVSSANTTLEMEQYAQHAYEEADDLLNRFWRIIKANASEEEYAAILDEQREWLTERDAKGQEALSADGSLANTNYNVIMAEATMQRCQELRDYIVW